MIRHVLPSGLQVPGVHVGMAHGGVVPLIRIERMTYCLQDSCSTN